MREAYGNTDADANCPSRENSVKDSRDADIFTYAATNDPFLTRFVDVFSVYPHRDCPTPFAGEWVSFRIGQCNDHRDV